jgi:hypothetical protein
MFTASTQQSSFKLSLASQIALIDMMSDTEKAVSSAFAWFYKLKKTGEHETSHPRRETIAKAAKCSVKSVSRFIEKYKFCFESVRQQKKTVAKGHNLWGSNVYTYDAEFFDLVCFLKEKGWWKNWKKMGAFITSQFTENEWDARSKYGYDSWVLNSQMSRGPRLKCPTTVLRVSSKPSNKVPTEQEPVPDSRQTKKRASEEIRVPGLSDQYKIKFDRFGSIFLAQEINKDYDFALKYGKLPRYPDRWVDSRLMAHMPYQYKILNRLKNGMD